LYGKLDNRRACFSIKTSQGVDMQGIRVRLRDLYHDNLMVVVFGDKMTDAAVSHIGVELRDVGISVVPLVLYFRPPGHHDLLPEHNQADNQHHADNGGQFPASTLSTKRWYRCWQLSVVMLPGLFGTP